MESSSSSFVSPLRDGKDDIFQLHIQLNQPRRFRGQLLLLRERLTDLSLCRCLLVIEVFKLLLNAAQTLRHFIQRVLDADKVASGIRTEFNAMGHPAFSVSVYVFHMESKATDMVKPR